MKTLGIVILIAALIVAFVLYEGLTDSEALGKIQYLLFEKATDQDNGSTTSRTIPLLMNWGAFTEHPILGCGNGLQGYYYEKYFPEWAYHVAGSDVLTFLQKSQNGISNAGIFTPALLSGYGIVGCACVLAWIHKLRGLSRISMNLDMRPMFILSGIAFLIMGFQGDAYAMYFAWFGISLPLCKRNSSLESGTPNTIPSITE